MKLLPLTRLNKVRVVLSMTVTLIFSLSAQAESELSGNITVEYRLFQHSPLLPEQHQNNISLSARPEFFQNWDDGKQSFLFIPFVRIDQQDSERTHADIRELSWIKSADTWEFRLGIRKVFWGVTESQHLVDIINQSDAVENLDGEDKLGQPMINLALIKDWGTVDFFILPGFRERTFAGEEGRLRFPFVVDTDNAQYESSRKNRHVDYAVRWSHSIDDWDLGISHFNGTNREPSFVQGPNSSLVPYYTLIDQTGLEAQKIVGDWLLKLEVVSRKNDNGRYTALTGGFENTLVGIFETSTDLGFLAEYLFDDRKDNSTIAFSNDLLIGTRLAMNDVQSTELLAGIIIDLDNASRVFTLEASRRLGAVWKLNIEAKLFNHIDKNDVFFPFRQDDHVQAELAWYF